MIGTIRGREEGPSRPLGDRRQGLAGTQNRSSARKTVQSIHLSENPFMSVRTRKLTPYQRKVDSAPCFPGTRLLGESRGGCGLFCWEPRCPHCARDRRCGGLETPVPHALLRVLLRLEVPTLPPLSDLFILSSVPKYARYRRYFIFYYQKNKTKQNTFLLFLLCNTLNIYI